MAEGEETLVRKLSIDDLLSLTTPFADLDGERTTTRRN